MKLNRILIITISVLVFHLWGCGQTEYTDIIKARYAACSSSEGLEYLPEDDQCLCNNGIICEKGYVCNTFLNTCIKHQISTSINYSDCNGEFQYDYARTSEGTVIWEGRCSGISGATPNEPESKCEDKDSNILYIDDEQYTCVWGCKADDSGVGQCIQKSLDELNSNNYSCSKGEQFCFEDNDKNTALEYKCTNGTWENTKNCNKCDVEKRKCFSESEPGATTEPVPVINTSSCEDEHTLMLNDSSHECVWGCKVDDDGEAKCIQKSLDELISNNYSCKEEEQFCFEDYDQDTALEYTCTNSTWNNSNKCKKCDEEKRKCHFGEDTGIDDPPNAIDKFSSCEDEHTLSLNGSSYECVWGCKVDDDGEAKCIQKNKNEVSCTDGSPNIGKVFCFYEDNDTANQYQCNKNGWSQATECNLGCDTKMQLCACDPLKSNGFFRCDPNGTIQDY